MSVSLLRIDDRLVHGQVVEGWLKSLRINRIVVASDTVAADEMQQALYLLAVPSGVQLNCLTVDEAALAWKKNAWESDKVLVLVTSPNDALRLQRGGAPLHSLNVGGLHFRSGRIQILKAVSLDDQDAADLRELSAQGVQLEARPLPLDEPVNMVTYLDRWATQSEAMKDQPR